MEIVRPTLFSLLMLILVGSVCLAQDDHEQPERRRLMEKRPGVELQSLVRQLFADASSISIKYSRLEEIEHVYLSKETAESRWQYLLTQRCAYRCAGAMAELEKRLMSGRKIDGECPRPFFVVVEFHQESRQLGKVFVNGTGQCFSIVARSYYIDAKLSFIGFMRRIFEPLRE